MSSTFARHPQSAWLRRPLFQLHLWSGIGIGLYVALISLSGSAIVFRRELDKALCPRIVMVAPRGHRMTDAQLAAVARASYPRLARFAHVVVGGPRVPGAAVEVSYVSHERRLERLFDPYTGQDYGDTVACEPRFITGIAAFHGDLFDPGIGLIANGAGAVLLTVMCLTGAILWWPGTARWRRSLVVRRHVGWRRFVWDLHSMLGFWLLLLVLMWAVTGIYLAFPDPFNALVELFTRHDMPTRTSRLINASIDWLVRVHFGRTFGPTVKVLWVLFGLVPAALFVTGALMWWNRVLRKSMGRAGAGTPAA